MLEIKLALPFKRTIWQCISAVLKVRTHSVMLLLGLYPREIVKVACKDVYTRMSSKTLFLEWKIGNR